MTGTELRDGLATFVDTSPTGSERLWSCDVHRVLSLAA
jgi:hypothetical protein